jgi:hypothetical protein
MLLICSCSYHISKYRISDNVKVFIENNAVYYPDGFEGVFSTDLSGAIAIADSLILFEGGVSGKPWVNYVPVFIIIPINSIDSIEVKARTFLNVDIFKFTTKRNSYYFRIFNSDVFIETILKINPKIKYFRSET